jgi:hypothetical protein
MIHGELTIAEILKDPLIRQVMRADGVSLKEMRHLLQHAERIRTTERQIRSIPAGVAPATVLSRARA